jgi:ABC-type ATPase with predicted acetyltransferase domain
MPVPHAGEIILITGPSGSGKTRLLRAMRRRHAGDSSWIDLNRIHLPNRLVVDCFNDSSLDQALARLCRVGLGEVWTYLKRPNELSTGQRFRLRLALALQPTAPGMRKADDSRCSFTLFCDEFAAALDRVSACVAARALRRSLIALPGGSALLVTNRDDIEIALNPNWVIECDFGASYLRQGAT